MSLLVSYFAPLLFDHLWGLAFASIVKIRCQVLVKQIDEIKAFGINFVKLRLIELMLIFTLDPLSKEIL